MHREIHFSQVSMQTNNTMWKIFTTTSVAVFLKTTFNQETDGPKSSTHILNYFLDAFGITQAKADLQMNICCCSCDKQQTTTNYRLACPVVDENKHLTIILV